MPAVDDTIVQPETREEMLHGRRLYAAPAREPHADRHSRLDHTLQAHLGPDHIASSDLLTRTSANSNFATDACIRRAGIDPSTGHRYLEELAFEIVHTQPLREITERAEELTRRGVRRVFAIFAKTDEVAEWSANGWVKLPPDSSIEDRTLVRPMLVRAMLDAEVAYDESVEALAARGNRRLAQREANSHEQGHRQGHEQGRAQGLIRGIETACNLLDLPLGESERAHMHSLDAQGLEALLSRLQSERRWPF